MKATHIQHSAGYSLDFGRFVAGSEWQRKSKRNGMKGKTALDCGKKIGTCCGGWVRKRRESFLLGSSSQNPIVPPLLYATSAGVYDSESGTVFSEWRSLPDDSSRVDTESRQVLRRMTLAPSRLAL